MHKYLFIYRHTPIAGQEPSPEQIQQMLAQWTGWKEKFKAQVVNMGDGLQPSGRQLKAGEVIDGPFAESKEIVGGYSIVQAESYEAAMEVARECPATHMPGSVIEVRELMGY